MDWTGTTEVIVYKFLLSYPHMSKFQTDYVLCNKHVKKHHSLCEIAYIIYSVHISYTIFKQEILSKPEIHLFCLSPVLPVLLQ